MSLYELANAAAGSAVRPRASLAVLAQNAVAAAPARGSARSMHKAWIARAKKYTARAAEKTSARMEMQAEHHNQHVAMRQRDLIARKRDRITAGSGGHKRLLPQAMLRLCFGKRGRVRTRGKRASHGSPLASSSRAVAAWTEGGHSHVQKVRNAVSQVACSEIQKSMTAIFKKQLDMMVVEMRWDETHVEVAIPEPPLADGIPSDKFQHGCFPLVISKGTLVWQEAGSSELQTQPIVVPPAILSQSCTTEELEQALQDKLPKSLAEMQANSALVAIILGHDSHTANIKYVKKLINTRAEGVYVLSSRCAMHQTQICLKDAYTLPCIAFHNELFCACNLLHGKMGLTMKRHSTAILKENFRVRHRPPPDPAWRRYAESVLDLLFYSPTPRHRVDDAHGSDANADADPEDEHTEAWAAERRRDGKDFLAMFNGNWLESVPGADIIHWCPDDCACTSPQHSLERTLKIWDKVINHRKLPIASVPRWTKYQRPCTFKIHV